MAGRTTTLPDGQIRNMPVQLSFKKFFAFAVGQITFRSSRHPVPNQEGRFAVVTKRWRGMRWTQAAHGRMRQLVDGEVVWSWHRDAGVKLMETFRKRRWQESPFTGESTKEPVKTIRVRECRVSRPW
jgi:hypothetical protein